MSIGPSIFRAEAPQHRPVSELYREASSVYAAIANDRDFSTQAKYLIEAALPDHVKRREPVNCLELFAGPARHSSLLASQLGHSAYCIDNSQMMQQLACTKGGITVDHYAVATLPCSIRALFPGVTFQLIFAPRYSIGYIRPHELRRLIVSLSEVLASTGVIVFEIHEPQHVANLFQSLQIRERSMCGDDGTRYRCVWPHGLPTLLSSDGLVAMSVQLTIDRPDGEREEMLYRSEEFLYTGDQLERLAASASLTTRRFQEPTFPGSLLVVHRWSLREQR